MTPQVAHSLRQYLIMIVLAALGVVVENQTGIIDAVLAAINLGDPYRGFVEPMILALFASSVRWIEGLRDASRAEEGKVIESDVAYTLIEELAENPSVPQVEWGHGNDIYVTEPEAQVAPASRFPGDDWLP